MKLKRTFKLKLILTTQTFCMLLLTACSSKGIHPGEKKPEPLPAQLGLADLQSKAKDSNIDIQYILGRDHYRFSVQATGPSVIAKTYLNNRVLDQGEIDSALYPNFLHKIALFVDSQTQRTPSSVNPCRYPFVIAMRVEKSTQTVKGCRSSDGGAFSKLVHDGEFLLYSKK